LRALVRTPGRVHLNCSSRWQRHDGSVKIGRIIPPVISACMLAVLLLACATFREPAPAPPMLLRADWGAQAPVAGMNTHRLTHITVHHTAIRQNPTRTLVDKLQGLQKFSQNEGKLASGKTKPPWPDIPYHYYIDCHGQIAEAREFQFVGDTNTEYDPTGHALVVLEGNFEEEQMTEAQLAALRATVAWLALKWRVPAANIQGHRDYAKTQCPGRNLENYLPELRQFVGEHSRGNSRRGR
jgi:hypothetical protein